MKAPVECTLLDLVQTLNDITDNDQEVVAAAVSLINSGRVRLSGNFAGATIIQSYDSTIFAQPTRSM
jgi:hypothetical protein